MTAPNWFHSPAEMARAGEGITDLISPFRGSKQAHTLRHKGAAGSGANYIAWFSADIENSSAIASKSNQIFYKGQFSDDALDSALMETWLNRQWQVAIPNWAHWP